MKVAVTGASGFIGRHVIRALAECDDIDIVAASRTRPPVEDGSGRVRYVALDVAGVDDDAFLGLGRPDLLIHLAWGGLPQYHSRHHFEEQLPAHYRFLSKLVAAGLPAMTVVGTCFEYGMRDGILDEDLSAEPANPYAFAKASLLRQLTFLKAETPFHLTWPRLFYMYGAGQAPTSLYSQLHAAIRRGDAAFAMSRGDQLRDFLPIENVARFIVALALRGADDGIVNVCSGRPMSVRAIVEHWIAEAGATIALDLGRYPYPTYEPLAFWGSNAKLSALIDITR